MAEVLERAGRSVVTVNEGGRRGVSGTVWRDGLVVTADHTIRDLNEVTLVLPDGSAGKGTVAGRDATTDLALLKLGAPLTSHAEFADAAQLRTGHFVLALGRRANSGVVASHGMLSAVGGSWRSWYGGRIDQWLRLDVHPFTGFSGGPLVDAEGRVIGINTSGPRRSVMTLPATTVNRVVDQLLKRGKITRGYLGIGLQPVDLTKQMRTATGQERGRALLVAMVEPGGPAEKAGIMIGDILVALEGKPLASRSDLQDVTDSERVGKSVQLRILRGGAARDVAVTIGERDQSLA
jgi:S1-C subfamily serine protease